MFRPAFRSSLRSLNRTTLLSNLNLNPSAIAGPSRLILQRQFLQPHRRLLSDDVRSKLQAAVKATPVVLFMKGTPAEPQCGFSRAVVQILDLHGVPPEKMQTYNVLEDPELRSGIKEFSEWPTVPQIYVNGEFVGGCDILIGMHQSGELETLLENNGVIPKIEEEASSPSSSSSTATTSSPKEEKASA